MTSPMRHGLRAVAWTALTAAAAAQAAPAAVDGLGAAVRDFAATAATGQPPWDRLLAGALRHEGPITPATLAALRELLPRGRSIARREADVPTVRAVWQRFASMAALGNLRPYALLNGAELEYETGAEADAVRLFEAASEAAPWLRFHAQQRLYYVCQDWRDCTRARAALEQARACVPADEGERLRFDLMECHCGLRDGRFAAAYEALARAQGRRPARIDEADRENLTVAALDLGLETGDMAEVVRLARARLAEGGSPETLYRCGLGLAVALGRCGTAAERDEAMAMLTAMLADAVPRNRPFVLQELIELHLHAGDAARAAALARQLTAGRPWDALPAPQRVTAIAAEVAAAADALAPDRRAELADVLAGVWSRLVVEWRDMPVDGHGVAFLQQKFRRNVLALLFELDVASGAADAAKRCLARYLEADSLGSTARRAKLAPPTAPQLQALAPRDGALLAYLPTEAGSWCFVVTSGDVELCRLPSSLGLERDAAALRRAIHACDGPPSAELGRQLAALGAVLLPAGVQTRVHAAAAVAVAGRELCGGVPFECLPWPDAAQPRLGLAKPIAYVPSLAAAAAAAAGAAAAADRAGAAGGGVTMVATPPSPAAGLRVLVGSAIQPGDRATWRVEPVALPAGWRDAALGAVAPAAVDVVLAADRRALLHSGATAPFVAILAHGVLDGTRPLQNGLLLDVDAGARAPARAPASDGRDGTVWPEDIAAAGPPGRLVFLGVCGAAAGALKRGEDGAHHLGGAFLQAGARGVVLSDQSIFLDATLATLGGFTRALVAGSTAAEGLLAARRAAWRARPSMAALAAFRYEGLPGLRVDLPPAPLRGPAAPRWLLVGGAAATLVAAAVAFVRRLRGGRRADAPRALAQPPVS